MRIISGKYKGKRLAASKNLPVRPTTDMAKESLFNILNNYYYFNEISVLDLFSGTGNISFEFASRGTKQITAVDQYFGCTKFISDTSRQLDLPIKTIKSDVYKFLEKNKLKYDVIFADPPYDFEVDDFAKIPKLIFENDLLEEGGLLIVEHSKHTDLSHLENYSYSKKYGGNLFSFFELEIEE
ncbi:16S rRNA (guanine(966)-N(2))-methyltransferase RsmD [Aureivirga marina]|uniref:16S rRNA (guanine(966)-N(2))-methyltransferase RsmD n=1 Tax=Aureivirga marina TaxID=1182451 RepID=UPI0018CA91A1|nr:16S rRNA (guanine(966)-N(2))-methyltransferase RsmD [Aureivirga marina]